MFLGVVLHATMPYCVKPFVGLVQDPVYHHPAFDFTFFFIHTFRMQLFYVIAGFFFRLLYIKIGEPAFIKHRAQRILLPFVVGLFTILPLTYMPAVAYRVTGQWAHLTLPEGWQIIRESFVWRGPLHLWFLYYLSIFYLVGLLFLRTPLKLVPGKPFPGPSGLFLLTVMAVSFATLCLFDSPYMQYAPGLVPKVSYLSYYGFFCYLGWYLHAYSTHYFPLLKRYALALFLPGLLLAVGIFFIFYFNPQPPGALLAPKLLMSVTSLLLVAGVMGMFLRWVNAENPHVRWLSDSSYWVYLVHVALMNLSELYLGDVTLWGPVKFLLAIAFTMTVSLVTYRYCVRYTIIGYYLHGTRKRSKPVQVKGPQEISSLQKNNFYDMKK